MKVDDKVCAKWDVAGIFIIPAFDPLMRLEDEDAVYDTASIASVKSGVEGLPQNTNLALRLRVS